MKLPSPKILLHQFLQSMRMRNCSEATIRSWNYVFNVFSHWSQERGIECLSEVTPEIMGAYRRYLFHYRNAHTGKPLTFDTQAHYLMMVRRWFVWMKDQALIESDPTRDIELPKSEERLPTVTLSAEQVELLLNQPDINSLVGIRDRTIMEVLYSSGIRCGELVALDVYDIHPDRGVLTVRRGKGRKDRVVPIGKRALSWVEKYLNDIRPDWVNDSSAQALFVSNKGRRLVSTGLSVLVKKYLKRIGITERGSCHLLRHAAATLMMEGGADLRSLQEFLGHKRINTTQIYTHVSIKRLQEVHRKTHPASPNGSSREAIDSHTQKKDDASSNTSSDSGD